MQKKKKKNCPTPVSCTRPHSLAVVSRVNIEWNARLQELDCLGATVEHRLYINERLVWIC